MSPVLSPESSLLMMLSCVPLLILSWPWAGSLAAGVGPKLCKHGYPSLAATEASKGSHAIAQLSNNSTCQHRSHICFSDMTHPRGCQAVDQPCCQGKRSMLLKQAATASSRGKQPAVTEAFCHSSSELMQELSRCKIFQWQASGSHCQDAALLLLSMTTVAWLLQHAKF